MCIHIADSLRCTAETNTTLESNYTPLKKILIKKSYHGIKLSLQHCTLVVMYFLKQY